MNLYLQLDMLFGSPQDQLALVRCLEEHRTTYPSRYRSCSLIFGAIDQLQGIADRCGFPTGDWLRLILIYTLRKALRASDLLTPTHRDTFIIILPHTPLAGAAAVAERLHVLVQKKRFSCGDRQFCLTLSLAVTAIQPYDSLDTLKDRLDQTLSLARQSGGNRIRTESDLASSASSEQSARVLPEQGS